MRHFWFFILFKLMILPVNGYAEEKVWRIQVYKPNVSHMYNNFVRFFVKPINEELSGELRIEAYAQENGKRLVTNKDSFSAVKYGRIEGMYTAPLYWGHIDPVFSVVGDLVAAWSTPEDYVDWFDNYGGEKFIQDAYAKQGMYMIGYTQRPTESLVSKSKLENLGDIKGKLIRVPSGGMAKIYFEKLGALPREISMELVKSSLEEGKLEMADFSTLGINYHEGLYDVAPHTNYLGFHSAPILDIVIGKDKWDALSKNAQLVVKKYAQSWQKRNLNQVREMNKKLLPTLKSKGVNIYKWSDDEIRKARKIAIDVWDLYAKRSPESKAAVDSIKSWHRENGGLD